MVLAPRAPNHLRELIESKTTTPQWSELADLVAEGMGSKCLFATDDWFSNAECLMSPEIPVFIPGKFTCWGKWMDGWESRRKRVAGHDWCILELGKPATLYGFEVDTGFFTGNQAPAFSIQAGCIDPDDPRLVRLVGTRHTDKVLEGGGFAASEEALTAAARLQSDKWTELVPKANLRPGYEELRHHFFDCAKKQADDGRGWTHIRVNIYPDGGVTRLRARGVVTMPKGSIGVGNEPIDLAAALNGGIALGASNAHYGRASNLIAPRRAANMGEGWETARNPDRPAILETDPDTGVLVIPPHTVDWAIVRLCGRGFIKEIELDTNHFKGNCPESALVEGVCIQDIPNDLDKEKNLCLSDETQWTPLLVRTRLEPHKRQFFELKENCAVTHLRIKIYPDGGVSRLRALGHLAPF